MELAPISTTYADARAAFLDVAVEAGAVVTSSTHPLTGLEGEELAVDVAEIGPADADDVVVVVSGTHGVEGYLGSALQRHHLAAFTPEADRGPAFVFVHALNPYGFSWVRRVNEDNVDLNRNFIDWASPAPTNPAYADIADLLVPTSWTEAEQERTMLGLLALIEEVGMEQMQQTVSGGQYDHPTGLFHGGSGPTWSNRWLSDFLATRLAGARRAAVIDLHTGLGPWGHGELISSESPDSAAYQRQNEWWDGVTSLLDGSSVSAQLSGEWLASVHDMAPGTELTAIAIEYGTVDVISVMQGLRADAVLHAHGDPTGADAPAIRQQVRAAFIDDDPAWLEQCWARYREVITAAGDRLS